MLAVAGSFAFVGGFLLVLYWIPQIRNRREVRRQLSELRAIRNGYPILIPVCDRPHYLRRVLDALAQVRNIDQTVLVFSQDERNEEVTQLIERCPLRKVHLRHTQPFLAFWSRIGLITRIHCTASNIYFAIDSVISNSEVPGFIVLEEDLVPSLNFYEYFRWCFERILLHPERGVNTLSCGAYNQHSKGNIGFDERYSLFCERDHFQPWGWAMSSARWSQIKGDWSFTSWDSAMDHRFMPRFALVNYRPYLSHIDCIGSHGINGSRLETARYRRTELDRTPIDFSGVEPVLSDGLPSHYQVEIRDEADPDYVCEYDRKLLPRIYGYVKSELLSPETRRALRKRLPFL